MSQPCSQEEQLHSGTPSCASLREAFRGSVRGALSSESAQQRAPRKGPPYEDLDKLTRSYLASH